MHVITIIVALYTDRKFLCLWSLLLLCALFASACWAGDMCSAVLAVNRAKLTNKT